MHPQLIPFIGEEYNKFKILHIGESHYIDQQDNNWEYSIKDLQNWFTEPYEDFTQKYGDWFVTDQILKNYLSGNRSKAHQIFTGPLKVFSKVFLNEEIQHITYEQSQNYKYFAFMNFYQMPACFEGNSFYDTLKNSAKLIEQPELADKMYKECLEYSSKIVDQVIDVIQPKLILITSSDVSNAYHGKYANSENVIYTVHPGCPHWNRTGENIRGKEYLEKSLKEAYHKYY